jgi:hypothetical protein
MDFLEQKEDQELNGRSRSILYLVLTYLIGALLIGTSIVGSILAILRLKNPLYGWISLGIGLTLLFPASFFLHKTISYFYNTLALPLAERPGVIIHGQRLYCTSKRCHGLLDPFEVFGDDESTQDNKKGGNNGTALELSSLQVPSIDQNKSNRRETPSSAYPNAGCGFGAFNVHLPSVRGRTGSSLSSMSASQNSTEKANGDRTPGERTYSSASILEQYERHVAAETEKAQIV